MRKISLFILCACLAPCTFAGTLRSEIKAMNIKIRKTMLAKDADAFSKVCKAGMTPDFKYTENGQSMDFDTMVSQMREGWKTTEKVTKVVSTILSCKEKGKTGTAKMHHVMEGTMKGQDGKMHTYSFIGDSIDTFKKVKGKWLMATMTWGSQKMLMDGKPMDPSKMGG